MTTSDQPSVVVTATTGHWVLPARAQCSQGGSRCTGIGHHMLDPYESDVYNKTVMRYLCDPCAQDIADAI